MASSPRQAKWPPTKGETEIYRAYFAMWMHQDKLMWSRVTWALTVEAGVLAASFARPGLFGATVLATGTAIVVLNYQMFRKDQKDRNLAWDEVVSKAHNDWAGGDWGATAGPKPSWTKPWIWLSKTSNKMRLVFGMAVVINALLFFAHLHLAGRFSPNWLPASASAFMQELMSSTQARSSTPKQSGADKMMSSE